MRFYKLIVGIMWCGDKTYGQWLQKESIHLLIAF